MYWDIIIIGVILALVIVCFRKFSSFVYVVGIIDIMFRLIHFIANNMGVPEIKALVNRIGFPESIPGVISKYTDGVFTTVLIWVFVAIMIVFEFYVIRTFWRKKK